MTDIIVIGAGPAGLTSAIYALRAGKTVKVLEKNSFGGQINYSPKIENYPGFTQISGTELADALVEQAIAQGADFEIEEVFLIEKCADGFSVKTDCATHECKAVIIATGAKHRHLGVEGEDKYLGEGISFCAVCDGAFYTGKDVIVIGGGNSALQEALLLSETSKKVTIVQNLEYFTGEQRLVDLVEAKDNIEYILGATVVKFFGDEQIHGAVIRDTATGNEKEIYANGVFEAIGLAPENEQFENVAELERGYVKSDEKCLTSTPGIFTAGDCRTKNIRQIATAVADGAVAALAACDFIS